MRALSFYRPEFLWAFFFLGAILAIHLLRRPRTKILDFSTLRFFQASVVHASRMRSIRKLLQLLTRLALAVIIIALFAAPFNRDDRFSMLRDPHLTVFTWTDRTPSMSYSEGGVSLLDRSSELLDSLVAACPATVKRLDYDEGREDFIPRIPGRLQHAGVRHGGAGLDAVLHAWDRDCGDYSLPMLVLCSAFQQSTTACLDSLLRMRSEASFPSLLCAMVPPNSPWNYTVHSAELRDRAGSPTVHAVITTEGRPIDSGMLTVTMASIRSGAARVSVQEHESAQVDIEVPSTRREGMVKLETEDPLSFDNSFWFTSQTRASRVIVVGDSQKNYPLTAAFAAASPARWNPVRTETGESASYDDLDSADIIVLNGIEGPSGPLEALQQGRAFAQKTILIALGGSDREFGQSASILSRIIPPTIRLRMVSDTVPVKVVLPDTISDVWRGFPRLAAAEVAVYRYVEGLPGSVLLRLSNGAPLVTRFTDHEGRNWVLAATPLGITDANNLCETGFFVPCLDRIMRDVASDKTPAADQWIAGSPRRNPYYGTGKGATVARSDGIAAGRWQSQPMVVFPEPGLYKVTPDGDNAYWIAVNTDPAESRLEYSPPRIPDAGRGKMLVLTEQQLFEVLRTHGRLPSYLPWIALFLLLIAELLLWERPEGNPPGKSDDLQIHKKTWL